MEVAEAHEIQIDKSCAGLSESQKGAATSINKHARNTVHPNQVGRRGPAVIGNWTARAKYVQRHAVYTRARLF